jgi:3-phosphoshikimate 1-carboxyvinyltransferase
VTGCGGRLPLDSAQLDLRGSGTGLRLLTAVCCLGPGPYVLDGDASLRARPLGGVEDVVRQLGCTAETEGDTPPVTVRGGPALRVPADGLCVDASRSSQPLTAALLVAGALPGSAVVRPVGPVVSEGYVRMTQDVLAEFGCRFPFDRESMEKSVEHIYELEGSGLGSHTGGSSEEFEVHGDWSSAAFLLGAAAATGGRVNVEHADEIADQPDKLICDVLARMGASIKQRYNAVRCSGGALKGVEVDLSGAPDLAPLIGALGCVAEGTTVVTGAPHLRIKESDRIASTVAAARAIGCRAEERDDGFVIHGGGATGGTVDPCGDHRLAMAFAVAGLAIPSVRIRDPGCVAKSYPGFWDDLNRLTSGA